MTPTPDPPSDPAHERTQRPDASPVRPSGPAPGGAAGAEPSYGNMSERHWSRTRGERNKEAIDYYRERSHAPGVREGGGPRNFYCMDCDGVIPHDTPLETCPHCGAELGGEVRRYFNWVEIDSPPASDLRALLPWMLAALLLVAGVVWGITRL